VAYIVELLLCYSFSRPRYPTSADRRSSPLLFSTHRHTHDHLRLLLDSLAASSSSSNAPLELSYDTRSRNVASETSQAAALASFEDLRRRLELETEKGLKVAGDRKINLEAVTPVVVEVESTWAREVRTPLPPLLGAR
jgi:hypothetical protein